MWLMLAHSLKFVNRPTRHYGQRAGVRQNERRTPSIADHLCTAADRPYMAAARLILIGQKQDRSRYVSGQILPCERDGLVSPDMHEVARLLH